MKAIVALIVVATLLTPEAALSCRSGFTQTLFLDNPPSPPPGEQVYRLQFGDVLDQSATPGGKAGSTWDGLIGWASEIGRGDLSFPVYGGTSSCNMRSSTWPRGEYFVVGHFVERNGSPAFAAQGFHIDEIIDVPIQPTDLPRSDLNGE